jgi:23S rRNA G2445 N2-methylase RlmL
MLNPAVAYLLLRIANPLPTETFCDPMAGVGTIAIEAVQAFGES